MKLFAHRRVLKIGALVLLAFPAAVLMFGEVDVWSDDGLRPDKQAYLDSEALFQSGELDLDAPTHPAQDAELLTPRPWPEGIFEDGQSPFKSYRIYNRWQGVVSGVQLRAFAGALRADPNQGIVIILANTLNLRRIPAADGYYYTPARVGFVRVASAEGPVLTLTTADEVTFRFDLLSRLFLDPDSFLPLPTLTAHDPDAHAGCSTASYNVRCGRH